jgi:hypothetical protein
MKTVIVVLLVLALVGCGPKYTYKVARQDQAVEDYLAHRITREEAQRRVTQYEREAKAAQDTYLRRVVPVVGLLGMCFGEVPGHGRVVTRTVPSGHGSYTTTYTIY